MRYILKSSIALALGAAVALGSIAPSLAMGDAGTSRHGVSQSGLESPMVLIRGGIRYQNLQDSAQDENDKAGLWQNEADLPPINGVGAWDRAGRSGTFY